MTPIFVAMVLAVVGVKSGAAEVVTFFTEKQFNGTSHEIEFVPGAGVCHNLTEEYQDSFSSLSTNGSCITVFALEDCTGDRRQLEDSKTPAVSNLADIEFDKNIRSFRDNCKDDKEGFIRFQNENGTSLLFDYDKTKCFNLPPQYTGITALVYNPDNCVALHEQGGCVGPPTQVPPTKVTEENDFTIEEAFPVNKTVRSFQPNCTDPILRKP